MSTPAAAVTIQQEQALKALDTLPPFSPILNKLLATLADEDVSFAQIAGLIEKDTVLAGSVLRVVNSAAYGCRGTVTSVGHAVAIMGLNKLRNTALSFSVTRLWRGVRCSAGWSMANFNLHSLAAGIMSDLLAQRIDVFYPEGAFVAGLFHDLGKLLLSVALPVEYQRVTDRSVEREMLGVTHPDLSALALERWNLPRPIRVAAAFHHDPESAPPDCYGQSRYCLAQVVEVADEMVNRLGIRVAGRPEQSDEQDFSGLAKLGMLAQEPALLADFQREFATVRGLF